MGGAVLNVITKYTSLCYSVQPCMLSAVAADSKHFLSVVAYDLIFIFSTNIQTRVLGSTPPPRPRTCM